MNGWMTSMAILMILYKGNLPNFIDDKHRGISQREQRFCESRNECV